MSGALAPTFVPWALPAAVGLAFGVALVAVAPVWVSGLPLAAWLLAPRLLAPRSYSARSLRRRAPAWLAWLVLAVPVGGVRHAVWLAAPPPLADLVGTEVTLTGRSDGRILTLEQPRGVRVALAGREPVGSGRVTVRGALVEPAGRRNPGGFDYRAYLRRRGVRAQLVVDEVVASAPRPDPRARFGLGVVRGLGPRQAALMQAMTLGVRDDLGDLREIFSASGLAHVLALSGLHVGVVMLAVDRMLRPLARRRYPVMMGLAVAFVALVGPTPSVVRAAAMVVAALASLWSGVGRIEPWPALALAALLTLLVNPSWLYDLSFQLSYLSVAGLLSVTGPVMARLAPGGPYPWWHWRLLLLGGVVTSGSAQALSLPLVASTFGSVPLAGPLVNVVAVPLATLLVPLGFLAALVGLVWLPLAGLVNRLTAPLAGALIALADGASQLPALPWGEVGGAGFLLYALAVLGLLLALHGLLHPWRALAVALAALLASTANPSAGRLPEIVFIDVGQGDSALIRLPGRREILIDGGGSPFSDFPVGARTVVPALRALDVDELDLVIASHADADHIEGLAEVLAALPVGQLVIGLPEPGKTVFDDLVAAARARGVPVRRVIRGETLELGDAALDILNPPRSPRPQTNDNSVAFVLRYRGEPWALFLGDVSATVERELAVPPTPLLMVAHHGSGHSTSEALLAAASPGLAVVSVGRNTFGHPHPEVLARLRESGARVVTTRERGAVRVSFATEGAPAP